MYTLTYQQKYIFKTSTITCIFFTKTKQIFTNVIQKFDLEHVKQFDLRYCLAIIDKFQLLLL